MTALRPFLQSILLSKDLVELIATFFLVLQAPAYRCHDTLCNVQATTTSHINNIAYFLELVPVHCLAHLVRICDARQLLPIVLCGLVLLRSLKVCNGLRLRTWLSGRRVSTMSPEKRFLENYYLGPRQASVRPTAS